MPVEIWTEKYRPKSLGEVVNQSHVTTSLKAWVKEGSIPHLIFAGPAGTGKTTCSIALARELFGEAWRENILELNASDERGIDVVRNRIKDFARTRPIGTDFHIVFLDESDALTPEAQQALRRTMEKYVSSCRFILSCNYSSRLIEPIRSRCSVFRFKRLSKEDVEHYVARIAKGEGLKIDREALEAVYEITEGDMRQATNLLQACSSSKHVTREIVYEVSSQAKPMDIRDMLGLALKGDFAKSREKLYELTITQGLAAEDIIRGMHHAIYELDVPDSRKIGIIKDLAEAEFRINQGATPEIQLECVLACMLPAKLQT